MKLGLRTARVIVVMVAILVLGVVAHREFPRVVNKAVESSLASVVESVMPSVVHIKYEGNEINYYGERVSWQGSGVIISENGHILTARHVCEVPGKFTVTTSDGREFVTKKACVSREYDVGFLKIDANDLPTVKFGDSDKMRLGSRLLAIGSPWGKQHLNSVTLGILSALNLKAEEEIASWGWEILFQTDVAANPGNSGGPVFSTSGELMGIVVGLYGPGCYAGITYCVPSNVCEKLIPMVKLTLALQDVRIVKSTNRIDKLEDGFESVTNDIWNIEKRLDNIESDGDDWEYYWDNWAEKDDSPYNDGMEW